jgi:hypothetical protein
MPHIFDEERQVMDDRRDFLDDANTTWLSLAPNAAVPFSVGGVSGTVTLTSVEVGQYGWGGCGNNIGTRATLRFESEGKLEDVVVGPQPHIFRYGRLKLALGEADAGKGTAAIALGI